MNIKIDKNKPIPSPASHNAKYPFREMQIGDSFAVPMQTSRSLSACASMFKKRCPEYNFTTRQEGDNVRCWRIKP